MKFAYIVAALCTTVALATPVAVDRRETTLTTSSGPVIITPVSRHSGYSGWWGRFSGFGKGKPAWWKPPAPASSSQTSTSTSSSAGQFYTAPPSTTQPASSTQQPSPSPTPSFDPASSPPQATQQTQNAASPSGSPFQGDQPYSITYAQPILDAHNMHRRNHSVPALTWSRKMEDYAKQIANRCYYAHAKDVGNGNFGQNIMAGVEAQNINAGITNHMYNDEMEYYKSYGGEPDESGLELWGHFTQIVWADSQQVGCWTTDCGKDNLQNVNPGVGDQFTVCNYYPPGNFVGAYGKNINRPGGARMLVVS